LSIQDITALLVSLINLSLSCYPDRIDYVEQVLSFAQAKVEEYTNRCVLGDRIGFAHHTERCVHSPDLYHPSTVQNLLSLLVAPTQAYPTPLTLLSLPTYTQILHAQPYLTRRAIGHAIVSAILKKETVISTTEEVKGVLDLCHVLVRDQKDANIGMPSNQFGRPQQQQMNRGNMMRNNSTRGQAYDYEEMAEEQGWVARLVHLFRNDDDDIQFKVRF